MPVIHTYASTPISAEQREQLKSAYGRAITCVPGKSERWLMCVFDQEVPIYLGGSDAEPAALVTVDVYARGTVARSAWEQMTTQICDELQATLGISPDRVYVKYGSTPDFGWNGMNF